METPWPTPTRAAFMPIAQSLIHMARRLYSHEDFGSNSTRVRARRHHHRPVSGAGPTWPSKCWICAATPSFISATENCTTSTSSTNARARRVLHYGSRLLDFERLHTLSSFSAFFVIRAKSISSSADCIPIPSTKRPAMRSDDCADRILPLQALSRVRRVKYYDSETHTTDQQLHLRLDHHATVPMAGRKWIKRRNFYGTSLNASVWSAYW